MKKNGSLRRNSHSTSTEDGYDAARYWFERAVQLGDKEAEGWLKTIEEMLAIINGESL